MKEAKGPVRYLGLTMYGKGRPLRMGPGLLECLRQPKGLSPQPTCFISTKSKAILYIAALEGGALLAQKKRERKMLSTIFLSHTGAE